jgi:hypothetical protein
MLPKEIIERIRANAKAFQENQIKHFVPLTGLSWYHAYFAGGKAEAERSEKLVELLKKIQTGKSQVIADSTFWGEVDQALAEYSNQEIKQP